MTRAELRKLVQLEMERIRVARMRTDDRPEAGDRGLQRPDGVGELQASVDELARREEAERLALLEPHAFIRPAGLPELLAKWCVRCRFTRADLELHPPEMQVETNNGAARAAGGS